MIGITVRILDSEDIELSIPSSFTVHDLKVFIYEKFKFFTDQTEIIIGGYMLNSDTKFVDVDFDGKVLQLVKRLPSFSNTKDTGESDSKSSRDELQTSQVKSKLHRSKSMDETNDINVKVELAFDMIRKSNDLLYKIENTVDTLNINNISKLSVSPLNSNVLNTKLGAIKTSPNIIMNDNHRSLLLPESMKYENSTPQATNASQRIKRDFLSVRATIGPLARQMRKTLPFSRSSKRNARNEKRASEAVIGLGQRCRLSKLLDQLNRLTIRFQPIYNLYCQYVYDHYHREHNTKTDNKSFDYFIIFNCSSKVMEYISKIYKAISSFMLVLGTGNIVYYSNPTTLSEIPSDLYDIPSSGVSLSSTGSKQSSVSEGCLDNNSSNDTASDTKTEYYSVLQNKSQNDNSADIVPHIYNNVEPSCSSSRTMGSSTNVGSPSTERFKPNALITYI